VRRRWTGRRTDAERQTDRDVERPLLRLHRGDHRRQRQREPLLQLVALARPVEQRRQDRAYGQLAHPRTRKVHVRDGTVHREVDARREDDVRSQAVHVDVGSRALRMELQEDALHAGAASGDGVLAQQLVEFGVDLLLAERDTLLTNSVQIGER
jgi:hypothetical protein